MKILYVTTVGKTMNFFLRFITELISTGNTVDIASNPEGSSVHERYTEMHCRFFKMPWTRSPVSRGNITAVKKLRKLLKNEDFDIVHCHTPIAAACTRIACLPFRKKGLKVVYTAHGFHFFKGSKIKNWLIYFPVEWLCSFMTDELITITLEDYEFAKKHLHASHTSYIPGVGIQTKRFSELTADKNTVRMRLGIPKDDFLLLSVGELNANKNQSTVISALAAIENKNIRYVVAGSGEFEQKLRAQAEALGLSSRVLFLGYRNDVPELLAAADALILPSRREGLNVSVMEAMAAGLPVICGDIRGNRDLIDNKKGGILCDPSSASSYAEAIKTLAASPALCSEFGAYNQKKSDYYSSANIDHAIAEIYTRLVR